MAAMNNFCDCIEDGYCPRYRREMGGRLREICAGVNCDLGTAAAFREQWGREASGFLAAPASRTHLFLKTDQAAGDTVAMTAAVYSLHKAHPGKYLTSVESPFPEVWKYNPDVSPVEIGAIEVRMHYPAIHQSNKRGVHFMQGWCEHLGRALGVEVPLMTNRPHLYFDMYDYDEPPTGDYWVVCSGGKKDFTNKQWHGYQSVVSWLRGRVKFIQVGATLVDHPPLHGATNLVGGTDLRHLFRLVRSARGVLCGVSLLMHVAAALEKPCIVIAGGREPVAWNAYPRQQYVHTVGALPCTTPQGDAGACWRSRTVPLGDGTLLDRDTCLYPVDGVPKCMTMIRPVTVVDLILRYNSQYE